MPVAPGTWLAHCTVRPAQPVSSVVCGCQWAQGRPSLAPQPVELLGQRRGKGLTMPKRQTVLHLLLMPHMEPLQCQERGQSAQLGRRSWQLMLLAYGLDRSAQVMQQQCRRQ